MERRTDQRGEPRGSALVATLGIVLVLALVTLGATSAVLHDSARVHQTEQVTQAAYVAGGAIDLFLSKAIPDPKLFVEGNEDLLSGSIGSGQYKISIEQVKKDMALVISTGAFADTKQSVRAYVRTNIWQASQGFDKAIFSENDIDWKGTSLTISGGAHSNQDFTLSGTAGVDGDLTATGIATGDPANVTGEMKSHQPRIPWPVLDIARYTAIAVANGEVIDATDKKVKLKGDYTPAGGVLWVKGAAGADVNNPTTINGCLIVDGPVNITAQNFIQAQRDDIDTPLPGIVLVDGDLKVTGGVEAEGLVYLNSSTVYVGGNMSVTGAIYAWDTLTGVGTAVVTYDPNVLQLDDPDNPARELAYLVAMERESK